MKLKHLFLILLISFSQASLQAEDVEPVAYQPLPTPYNVAIGVFTSFAEKPVGQPLGFIQNRIIQGKAIHKSFDKNGNRIPLLFQFARYYRGLPTSLVCGGISTGIELAAKEKICSQFNPNGTQLTTYQRLFAGGAAGAISSVVDAGIETINLRQQNKDKNLVHTLQDIWQTKPVNAQQTPNSKQSIVQGVRNFYRGYGAILSRNVISACGNWAAFEEIRKWLSNYISDGKINTVAAAGLTGLGTATITHPLTFAKTRLQGDLERAKYKNSFEVWKKAITTEGVFSIFKGYAPRVLRAIAASAVMFNTQDWLKTNVQQSYHQAKRSPAIAPVPTVQPPIEKSQPESVSIESKPKSKAGLN